MKATLSFERREVRVSGAYPVIFAGAPFLDEGVVRNLSVTGCQIECPRSVLLGSYVQLGILLFDQAPSVRVEIGAIRWASGQRFGVEFIRMPDEEYQRLRHFLGGRLLRTPGLVQEQRG